MMGCAPVEGEEREEGEGERESKELVEMHLLFFQFTIPKVAGQRKSR